MKSMQIRHLNIILSLFSFCVGGLLCPPAHTQFWDMLTKPQITVNLTHPPRLGLNIKQVAFGPSHGECSDEILDRLSENLISNGVEVIDRHRLHRMLDEQHIGFNGYFNGYLDQQSALRMGKLLGPTALIFVKISQCEIEQRRNVKEHKERKKDHDGNQKEEIVRSYDAIVDAHLRGSLQTVDLATGNIFSASPIVEDVELSNHSDREPPEFPSRQVVRDSVIERAAHEASTMFVKWNEEKKLYFFNDKECNMALAYAMLKANDFEGVIRQSEENIISCRTWPKLKDSSMAHAYYNAGLAYLLVDENEKAISYLTESEKLKGGAIVTETLAQANNSARLDAEMRRVAERTERFEQSQENMNAPSQPSSYNDSRPANPQSSPGSVEDRLKKLDSLFKQGLITRQEYEAKKAVILKEL